MRLLGSDDVGDHGNVRGLDGFPGDDRVGRP